MSVSRLSHVDDVWYVVITTAAVGVYCLSYDAVCAIRAHTVFYYCVYQIPLYAHLDCLLHQLYDSMIIPRLIRDHSECAHVL